MVSSTLFQVTRVMPRADGIAVWGRYARWSLEYSFFIQSDGIVKGLSNRGVWYELSHELATLIRGKVQTILIHQSHLIDTS